MSHAWPHHPTTDDPTLGTLTGRRRACRGALNQRYLRQSLIWCWNVIKPSVLNNAS
jgi:hypothetical protein